MTICHSRTRDLPAVCREAEILVAAIGQPAMITAEYIRPGAVVIDVGQSRIENPVAEAERIFEARRGLPTSTGAAIFLVGDCPDLATWRACIIRLTLSGAGRGGSVDHRHADEQYDRLGRATHPDYADRRFDRRYGLRQKPAWRASCAGCGCFIIEADEIGHEVMKPANSGL